MSILNPVESPEVGGCLEDQTERQEPGMRRAR